MLKRLAAGILLAFSAFAHADVTRPVCVQTGPNSYTISFVLTGESQKVKISASSDPSGNTARAPLLETSQSKVKVIAGRPGERMYFFLQPDHGRGREVSIRHIDLQGTPNFRDIGGYETSDGRFVKWGILYRSGVLTYLTPSDFSYLRQLGVRVVCDFRTHQENLQAPEKWIPNSKTIMISLPMGADDGKSGTASFQKFAESHPTTEQFRQMMEKIYSSFVFQFSPEYAKAFTEIEQDHLPLVYHCTAGKDRTGVFTALLLRVLGVPMTTILQDYSLTNRYFMSQADNTRASREANAQANSMIKMFTPDQRRVLMAADPAYLKATFAAIDNRYGSFDNYRRQALGVTDSEVIALRARLLTNE